MKPLGIHPLFHSRTNRKSTGMGIGESRVAGWGGESIMSPEHALILVDRRGQ